MEDSRELLRSVRDTIKEYVDGSIRFQQANSEYEKLSGYYTTLLHRIKPRTGNFLKGLLYHHNCENYTKLSAVCFKGSNEHCLHEYYGDANLVDVAKVKVYELFTDDTTEISKQHLLTSDGLDYYVYYKQIANVDRGLWWFAITSSVYFQEKYFTYLGQIIKTLYYNHQNMLQPSCINFIEHFSDSFSKYNQNNMERNIYADLYIFDSIGGVFGHLGYREFVNISHTICNNLKSFYFLKAEIFIFSPSTYIVLHEKDENKNDTSKMKKNDFMYNGITIPYQFLTLKINKDQSVYKLLDEIYIFENYVKQGDR